MDANGVQTLTESLLSEHGLTEQGWTYKPSRALTYAGQCRYASRVIAISTKWAEHISDEEVRNTILHEISHAIVGYSAKHNSTWKAHHRSIGGDGSVRFMPTPSAVNAVYNRTATPTKSKAAHPTITRVTTPTVTYAAKFDAGFTDFDSMFGY